MRIPARDAPRSDGRVRLRPYDADDVDRVYEAIRESIDQLLPWMAWAHHGYSRAESAEYLGGRAAAWRAGEDFEFAILDAASGDYLGGCGLNQINRQHAFANFGYWVRTARAGRGIATAAARLLARFGLDELELERLEITVPVGNAPSVRVAEKLGARREGVLRRRVRIATGMSDAVMFSLTRDGASEESRANGARRV